MYYDVEKWLEQVEKLDQLIIGKIAERDRLFELATNTSSKPMDGMPFNNTGSVSRKVENASVELALLADETDKLIRRFTEHKQKVIDAIEKLSPDEYAVLHRRYIRYMTWDKIASNMNYSTMQVWRIKKKAIKNLKDVMKCYEML
jgi:RNA polymerase sigma factor (sigma-70 family)